MTARVTAIENHLLRAEEWHKATHEGNEQFKRNAEERFGALDKTTRNLVFGMGQLKFKVGWVLLIAGGIGGIIATVIAGVVTKVLGG